MAVVGVAENVQDVSALAHVVDCNDVFRHDVPNGDPLHYPRGRAFNKWDTFQLHMHIVQTNVEKISDSKIKRLNNV